MPTERLRIAMFSRIVTGGAGHAALRVHDALRRQSRAESTLYVGRAEHRRHPGVSRLKDAGEGCQPAIVPGLTMFSVDPPGVPDDVLQQIVEQSDIFNPHWFARFLSLRNIEHLSRSGKPVVLTIRDMNPLTGGCHFFHGCERWKENCLPCPQFAQEQWPIPNATLEAKKARWNLHNITVVVLSDHTAEIVERSPLLQRCRVEKIPNPIDVSTFRPHDRDRARARFGVPQGKRAIAYLPSFGSSVKGSAQAVEALKILAGKVAPEDYVVLCAGELDAPLDVPFETVRTGFIENKQRLAQFYAAADVTLIPSTEETFSNTAAESVSCGTPIAGFQVGAIPEIAQGPRGRAVPLNNVNTLADGLRAFLDGENAAPSELHRYVTDNFGADAIAERYLSLFDDLHERSTAKIPRVAETLPDKDASARLSELLVPYRAQRAAEMEEERKALNRERRTLRGMTSLFARGMRLFFSDNAAFRSKVRNILERR